MSLSITMLGTGSPRPSLERSGPSQIVSINGEPILIDAGEGVVNRILQSNYKLNQIENIFFTHLHGDHIYGYAHFLIAGWGSGRKHLTVIGPEGTKKMHELVLQMYHEDIAYRTSLGFPTEGLLNANIIEIRDTSSIVSIDTGLDINVQASKMAHNVLTFAYRFDDGTHTIVISGDTAPTKQLVTLSQNADVLIHDCCLTTTSMYSYTTRSEMKEVWKNLQKEHSSPTQAAQTAHQANVKNLILTHFLPQIDVDEIRTEVEKIFSGNTIIPNDLDIITP
ncbi:hypothetical protein DOS68_05460 [Staphylococcus felis]|uniref:Uncharacterized protein n=1 Tax=Staphylococcus felis TaxID=46127 RepID=A0AAX1RV07_9STAP|nr:MBL fold metallo-hydrolase [Staphylococcus felis]REH76084.1 hypothetical protein DOS59_09080 [Staphylococcus felis]REH81756.1 hypothetical protein DOS56_09385 [Staphylococcus felis]REH87138.1 hypothetical protein DOS63_02005 [Staphylococcus felis]REH90583.1 hypothetical protein DOS68_05460 [Staphylococcus felis]REH99067.1 hypothetical protein DOS64_09920 [Staphylococcus felis]